jgi:NADP-dependent 3-hydroxy acid dehydrogenase YdfG
MKRIVLITGATSGIGEAAATTFAQNNFDLIITGRRNDRLDAIRKRIEEKYSVNVLPLCFDIRNNKEVEENIINLPDEWKNIDILINNAGLAAGKEPLWEGLLSDWEEMIDTNIKGLLYITKIVLSYMIRNKKGHIINIASIAGKEQYAGGNVYCSTKAAVDMLSKCIEIDALPYNIKVTNVAPGAVETEFSKVRFKGDKNKINDTYRGYKPLTGEDVAQTLLYCAILPEHINIRDIVILPTAQANATTFHKH